MPDAWPPPPPLQALLMPQTNGKKKTSRQNMEVFCPTKPLCCVVIIKRYIFPTFGGCGDSHVSFFRSIVSWILQIKRWTKPARSTRYASPLPVRVPSHPTCEIYKYYCGLVVRVVGNRVSRCMVFYKFNAEVSLAFCKFSNAAETTLTKPINTSSSCTLHIRLPSKAVICKTLLIRSFAHCDIAIT
jgi:hypothetical protein